MIRLIEKWLIMKYGWLVWWWWWYGKSYKGIRIKNMEWKFFNNKITLFLSRAFATYSITYFFMNFKDEKNVFSFYFFKIYSLDVWMKFNFFYIKGHSKKIKNQNQIMMKTPFSEKKIHSFFKITLWHTQTHYNHTTTQKRETNNYKIYTTN